jgi:hypothetical protein
MVAGEKNAGGEGDGVDDILDESIKSIAIGTKDILVSEDDMQKRKSKKKKKDTISNDIEDKELEESEQILSYTIMFSPNKEIYDIILKYGKIFGENNVAVIVQKIVEDWAVQYKKDSKKKGLTEIQRLDDIGAKVNDIESFTRTNLSKIRKRIRELKEKNCD